MIFEYMFSADIFVEDMYRQVDAMVERFGLHPPGRRSIVTNATDAHAIMCRLDRNISRAPTRLEVIQGTGSLEHWNGHHISEAWRQQVTRPARFHNTVFIARSLDELRAELDGRGVPTMFDGTLAFDRLWTGISPSEPTRYDPAHDAGLRIEVLPFDSFPLDPDPPSGEVRHADGALVRVVDRSFIVEDLDATLRTLDAKLGWEPDGPVRRVPSGGYREAALACRLPLSAKLLLRQPDDPETPLGAFAARWGTGPYAIGIAVAGLDAHAESLRARGVPFTELDGADGRHLRVGADIVGGTVFEFTEAPPADGGRPR